MRKLLRVSLMWSLLCFVCVPVLTVARVAASSETVKVGYMISLSGVYTALGVDLRDGFNLYMNEIGSKASGREIKVFVEDKGSNDVSRALDVGKKLVEKEQVNILAGIVGTGSKSTTSPLSFPMLAPTISHSERTTRLSYVLPSSIAAALILWGSGSMKRVIARPFSWARTMPQDTSMSEASQQPSKKRGEKSSRKYGRPSEPRIMPLIWPK
jgi:hypothetical protein